MKGFMGLVMSFVLVIVVCLLIVISGWVSKIDAGYTIHKISISEEKSSRLMALLESDFKDGESIYEALSKSYEDEQMRRDLEDVIKAKLDASESEFKNYFFYMKVADNSIFSLGDSSPKDTIPCTAYIPLPYGENLIAEVGLAEW